MSETPKRKKSRKRKKKTSTKKKVLITIGVILLFFLGIGISALGYGFSLLGKMDNVVLNNDKLGIDESIDSTLSNYKGIVNIALFGVDSIDGSSGRSDSIMILTIDTKNKNARLSSILRDSYVDIDGHGRDKINHAYAYGGPELAINTINKNFNLNISEFVSVDFSTLPKIIDALGGIEVNITQEELNSKYIREHMDQLNELNGTNSPYITKTGLQTLDGTQALVYARIRYTSEGDEGRTKRHQVILNAVGEKFKEISPRQYPKLLDTFLPYVKTSLSNSEIISLAKNVAKMDDLNIATSSFPKDNQSNGITVKGVYYLDFNKDTTVSQMHDYIFNGIEPQ